MRKTSWLTPARVIVVLACALLAGCGERLDLDRLTAGERARVAEVRSGDVLVLDTGLVVRLAGVETPRHGDPGADAAQADLQRLAGGRTVQLLYGGAHRDAYGRALAQVRRTDDRTWIEGALLRDGWARVRTYADNRAMSRPMLNAEAEARMARRGLWSMADYGVRLPAEISPADYGFQVVEGRVAAVNPGRSETYLDFTPDGRGFAAAIANRALSDMRAAGLTPASLTSHLVRVRGRLEGGLMRIDHPEQIERLQER